MSYNLNQLIQDIVRQSTELKNTHTTAIDALVNYSCIFAHSEEEYQMLDSDAAKMGKVVKETKMGNVYLVEPIQTVAGPLRIVKIRKPDPKRPERGDADFTLADYPAFKKEYLNKPGFKLIDRTEMEMIELADEKFDVLVYFSHPTLAEVLGIIK
jgi:hypothetical protein